MPFDARSLHHRQPAVVYISKRAAHGALRQLVYSLYAFNACCCYCCCWHNSTDLTTTLRMQKSQKMSCHLQHKQLLQLCTSSQAPMVPTEQHIA